MKVCIIGNSHIGALKWASRDGIFTDPAPDIVFWGMPGKKFLEVNYENGLLIPPDPRFALHVSGGKYETINPGEFDVLIFLGPPLNATALLRSLRKHQPDLLSYSTGFLRDGLATFIDKRPAIELIRQVRANYNGRIFASPQPLVSEQSNFFGEQSGKPGEGALIDRILRECFARHGADYIPQPAKTIVNEQYTAAVYSRDSVRLGAAPDAKHPDNDYTHMNGLYGAEVLRSIARELRI